MRKGVWPHSGTRLPFLQAIDRGKAEDVARLVAEVAEVEPPLAGIVHLWSLDVLAAGAPEVTAETLMAAQATGSLSVLHLVQALARHETVAPRLWIATSGGN